MRLGVGLFSLLIVVGQSEAGDHDYLIQRRTEFEPRSILDSVLAVIPTYDLAALVILNTPVGHSADRWPRTSLKHVHVFALREIEILASDRKVMDRATQGELWAFLRTAIEKYDQCQLHKDRYSNVGQYSCLLIGECLRRLGSPKFAEWVGIPENAKAMEGLPFGPVRNWEPMLTVGREFLAGSLPDGTDMQGSQSAPLWYE
ncbi:MAG: hypothetical protein EHM19_07970 [Candidatus Latescibacterota bacterium]|nr:MAG: hypothetical protein EHM19_07970 [Candidatus Latescibacterota bacterium]